MQTAMSIYGTGYYSDRFLLKLGKMGTTLNAALDTMASAGCLPQILDNVKSVDPEMHKDYVALISSVMEGTDKRRLDKDSKMKKTRTFNCTPLITGEIRPEEASTDARILNLSWSKPSLGNFNEAQQYHNLLPIIGYKWLNFVAAGESMALASFYGDFEKIRTEKEQEFALAGYVNPGRLATIYTVLWGTWQLLKASPMAEVFKACDPLFESNLKEAIEEQGLTVNKDTESAKFMNGLNMLLASQPQLFEDGTYDGIIGKHIKGKGLFLLPDPTLAAMNKMKVFTQIPTSHSMTKALDAAGYLIHDKEGKSQYPARINSTTVRGWLLKEEVTE
jgi:hypothetical protein